MKPGMVSDSIRKRSILKQLNAAGRKPEGLLLTEASRYGRQKDVGAYAIHAAVNDLAVQGAVPESVCVRIQLPMFACESRIRTMTADILSAAKEAGVFVQDIKAETVPVLTSSLVHVCAAGMESTAGIKSPEAGGRLKKEAELVLTKWAGMEGTLRILAEKREALQKRFVPAFLDETEKLRSFLCARREAETAAAHGVWAMKQVTEEGIFGSLWEIAETLSAGLTVSLKDIPIRQETVEICEHYHVNPYELTSAGCILFAVPDGDGLVEKLREEGIPSAVIGHLTDANDRIIMRGQEVSYLDRPQPEALSGCFAVWEKEEKDA